MAVAPPPSALSAERPFPGLRPFAAEDHAFFFGRQAQTYALYRLLDHSGFIAVVGSSGSGKSSLVRAGLLPLLDEERQSGGRKWLWQEMRPGDAPLERLTRALTRLCERVAPPDDPFLPARKERIGHRLRGSSFGLASALGEIKGIEGATIVLLVDQFEELFRYASAGAKERRDMQDDARSRDEAAQFVQLLIEATRSPSHDVHVLITMRSDFIGDCARFQSLPEAVSGTQFLVPSLTRDQREEVIREPITRANGTIEPALVERLLNDSGSELDQLPVLQHCLLRLWEEAGKPAPGDGTPPARALTLQHYEAIGGIAGALSQHADQILAGLPGLELAAEQIFRALSELDKEGRATRRALPFAKLCAEAGVAEADLRTVLDRFRGDDCSFLTPPTSAAERLEDTTRIDVGHEALLRRWERVSGVPGATGEHADKRPLGWLRQEERDGRIYRVLLSMVDHAGTGALPMRQAGERARWWKARPRTSAWGERYGGGFADVRRLIARSLVRRRVFIGIAAVIAALVLGTGYKIYQQQQTMTAQAHAMDEQRRAMEQQAEIAEKSFTVALTSAKKLLDEVLQSLNSGAISVKGARALLNTAEAIVRQVGSVRNTPETVALRLDLLLTGSDIFVTLGDTGQALDFAKAAQEAAARYAADDPDGTTWQRYVYKGGFRVADVLGDTGHRDEALQEYLADRAIVQKLVAKLPDEPDLELDLAFLDNKVGETLQLKGDFDGALKEFNAALAIAQGLVAKDATNIDWQLKVAATRAKIGNLLATQTRPDLDGALAQYEAAVAIEEELARRAPDNDVVTSNLALGTRQRADVLAERGDVAGATAGYTRAIEINERLVDKDPGDALWLNYLAVDYLRLGDLLKKTGDLAGALAQYRLELAIRQKLAIRDPNNAVWQRNLAASQKRVADLKPA